MSPGLRRARQKQYLAGNSPIDTGASYEVMRDCPHNICLGPEYYEQLQKKLKIKSGEEILMANGQNCLFVPIT
jgi:hypothetical protein